MDNPQHPGDNSMLDQTLLTEGDFALQDKIDLTNCEKEPIHIPGSIQPHGVLLALADDEPLTVVQCSANALHLLGVGSGELLGLPLSQAIGETQARQVATLRRTMDASASGLLHYLDLTIDIRGEALPFTGITHQSEGVLILELERRPEMAAADNGVQLNDFEFLTQFFSRMKLAQDMEQASRIAAEEIKRCTGYDRVMVYEFDEQWNGKVVAEAREPELEPFLGHHYPASDIPKQARQLYLRNWLRIIVDVGYVPSPIVPAAQPVTGQPLNLSLSVLRSVSPLHLEYLQNMQVGATMTISLIHERELWGLITCHHRSPKYVTHKIRNLCNFFGMFFSNELRQRKELDRYRSELQLKTQANQLARLFTAHNEASEVIEELKDHQALLLGFMGATGAAVHYRDRLLCFGACPEEAQVRQLAVWLKKQTVDYVYHTSALSSAFEPAKAYVKEASGALFVALSASGNDYIVWFRPELVQVVEWAGDPAKAVIQDDDGMRLSPRKSFEKWKQVVEGTSAPWQADELRVIPDLKTVLLNRSEQRLIKTEVQLQQESRLLRENVERYLQLMQYSPVAFFVLTDNLITFCNEAAVALFRAEAPERLLGEALIHLAQPEGRGSLQSQLRQLQHASAPLLSSRHSFAALDGTVIELETAMAQISLQGEPTIIAIAREAAVDEQEASRFKEINEQLRQHLNTDSLTEIPNRRFFEERVSADWERCIQERCPVALILLEIDYFKEYNEAYGQYKGDLCLQWVADALDITFRSDDVLVARYDGSKFAVYMAGTKLEEAAAVAEKVRQVILSLEIPHIQPQSTSLLTASLGVASDHPAAGTEFHQLVVAAEKALYIARGEGRNRVSIGK